MTFLYVQMAQPASNRARAALLNAEHPDLPALNDVLRFRDSRRREEQSHDFIDAHLAAHYDYDAFIDFSDYQRYRLLPRTALASCNPITRIKEMIRFGPLHRSLPLCIVLIVAFAFPIGRANAQDANAVGARLKAAGEKLGADANAGEFGSEAEALAKWHKIKEKIITSAVVAGEISEEEADVIRVDVIKTELAQLAKAVPSAASGMQAVGARLEAAGEKFRAALQEVLAEWNQTKERIIVGAVAVGEISREEAAVLRREIEKAEAAEQANATGDGPAKATGDGPAKAAGGRLGTGRVTAKQIISFMDKNGDGTITKNESPEDLKLYFEQYDANKDGAIDVKEAEALVKYVNEQAGQ